jgi:predicted tellurium resistance membrane protein TerC
VLVFGLGLPIALMGSAVAFIARLLQRHRWITHLALVVLISIAFETIYRRALEVWPVLPPT